MAVTAALFGSVLVAAPAQALNDTGSGGVFVPASGRILDTKNNIGGYNTPMPVKTWRTITVGGRVGVPNDGTVGAVSVVATVADISGQGILYGRPNDTVKTTTMGVYGGENKQNTSFAAVLAVDEDGTIEVQSETAVRLILDVQGYYTTDTSGTAAGGFVPLNGERIVDTRSALGAPKLALAPGKSIDVQVTGKAGIPAGASAAVVNMIAVNTTSTVGYLTPYPTGGTRPSNSFNYAGGVITSMSAQVKLSASGKMTIFNDNSTTNIVVDIQGYFTAAGAGGAVFTPAAGRVYDTRTAGNTVMGTNETRPIQVAGVSGIPVMGSGIVAVVLTMTSLKSTSGGGNATVWADGTPRPSTTAINFDETTIRTNTITVPLGANGKISLGSVGGPTNYVFDIQGWYVNPTAPVISCPPEYTPGGWTNALPKMDVVCTITAAPATDDATSLFITVDGEPKAASASSTTSSTSVAVAIPAKVGWHEVDAVILSGIGDLQLETFTLGINDGVPSPILSAIQKASPDSFVGITTGTTTATGPIAVAATGDVDVTVPTSAQGSITLSPGNDGSSATGTLSTALPFATSASRARVEANGIVSFDNGNGSFTVPITHDDGSVQINTVLNSASSPNRFTYPMTVPSGASIQSSGEGSITFLSEDGVALGGIEAPWAFDATGMAVPTQFELVGSHLTQTVDLSFPGIQYPVVADPGFWATAAAVAGCVLEIAAYAIPTVKVVKAFASAGAIIKASNAALKFYAKLGGTMQKVMEVLKTYVKNKSALSAEKLSSLKGIFQLVGKSLFALLGLSTCGAILYKYLL